MTSMQPITGAAFDQSWLLGKACQRHSGLTQKLLN